MAVMATDDSPDAQARRGLEVWAAFPAHRDPRPVVLLDMIPPVYLVFTPDEQTRLALLHGVVEAVPGFPAPSWRRCAVRTGRPQTRRGPPARTLELGNAALVFTEKRTYAENLKPGRRGFRARVNVGRTRQVTAALSRPLGDRILLDATGRPVLVTPEQRA